MPNRRAGGDTGVRANWIVSSERTLERRGQAGVWHGSALSLAAVPWCPPCERYLAPSAVSPDGACPFCDQAVEPGPLAGPAPPVAAASRVPWHFWILLALAVAYLGWRAVQGVALLL